MQLRNSTQHYGHLTILIHWLMALLIISLLVVGFYMTDLPKGDDKWALYGLHKATGFIVLLLALFRWYWMLSSPKVAPQSSYTRLDIKAALASKWLLMVLLLLMPLSGFLMSATAGRSLSVFGLFEVPKLMEADRALAGFFNQAHSYIGWTLTVVVTLHFVFVLKHHFIRKDATLTRMLGKK
jgi:cytochrome b561